MGACFEMGVSLKNKIFFVVEIWLERGAFFEEVFLRGGEGFFKSVLF